MHSLTHAGCNVPIDFIADLPSICSICDLTIVSSMKVSSSLVDTSCVNMSMLSSFLKQQTISVGKRICIKEDSLKYSKGREHSCWTTVGRCPDCSKVYRKECNSFYKRAHFFATRKRTWLSVFSTTKLPIKRITSCKRSVFAARWWEQYHMR